MLLLLLLNLIIIEPDVIVIKLLNLMLLLLNLIIIEPDVILKYIIELDVIVIIIEPNYY